MSSTRIVTLLTDFGGADGYVGQMKGSLLRIAPECTIVDLSHEVPPQAVAAGAYLLETCHDAFPDGTVHVAVVDPGVGTPRRALAIETRRFVFIGPDNGLLSRAVGHDPVRRIHAIDVQRWRRPGTSVTFDGRDLFAPVAAWVCRGIPIASLGPRVESIVSLDPTGPRTVAPGLFDVHVIYIDRFGNVTLDLRATELLVWTVGETSSLVRFELLAAGQIVRGSAQTYADAQDENPFLLFNSAGYLEIACRDASASEALGLTIGDCLRLRVVDPPGTAATP